MSFALPHLLWLLAVPAALLAWELSRRRNFAGAEHPKILRAEAGLRSVSLYPRDAAPAPLARRRFLMCAGLALGAVALARPQWGRLDEPVFDQSREIVIAIDLSRSMLTPDVKPDRLERAKLLIQSLLDRLRGERVGLIVFSGTAFLQSPPSADYEILREFLPALGPDFLPEGGTNYGELIDAAVEAFGEGAAADRYLIILSDGEATDEGWRSRVPELARRGIRVIGLGVGTAGGGMIPDGAGAFMKDERGAVVLSKLESGTLRDLAAATHGAYRDASDWVDLPALLASTVDAGRRGRFVERNTVRHVERYQWALAQALVCLVASFWLEFPVRPRSRAVPLSEPRARRPSAPAVAALAALALLAGTRTLRAEEARDPAASLSKVVGRLAAQDTRSAVDWAEMASDTLSWGQELGSGGQKVPEGPVRDALEAVDLGSRADPKAADWERLRTELKKLLENPEQKKQDDQKQQQNQQQRDQQQQQDQKQDPKQQGQPQDQRQNQDQNRQQQNSPQEASQPRQQQGSPRRQSADSQRANPESAFGKMGGGPTPTPKEEGEHAMQRVGGSRKEQENDPARRDPQLAVPLEKLDQLRSEDSPAELFGLLRKGEPTPTPVGNGKNW
jgi:Ca-activated chloride channel family protein